MSDYRNLNQDGRTPASDERIRSWYNFPETEEEDDLFSPKEKTESEIQPETSDLSSQILMLRNELQKKSEKIVSLNSQLSDLELEKDNIDLIRRKNLELVDKNSRLQKRLEDAEKEEKTKVERAEREKDEKIKEIKSKADMEKRNQRISFQERNTENLTIIVSLAVYGFLLTVLMFWINDYLIGDLLSLFKMIGNGLRGAGIWVFNTAIFVGGLADAIPIEVLALILHWVLFVLVLVLALGVIAGLFFLVYKAASWLRKVISKKVTTVVLACILLMVFLGSEGIRYAFF